MQVKLLTDPKNVRIDETGDLFDRADLTALEQAAQIKLSKELLDDPNRHGGAWRSFGSDLRTGSPDFYRQNDGRLIMVTKDRVHVLDVKAVDDVTLVTSFPTEDPHVELQIGDRGRWHPLGGF